MAEVATPAAGVAGAVAAVGPWRLAGRRFVRHRLAVVALVVLVLVVLVAFVGSRLWHHGYRELAPADASQSPSWAHPMGTDDLGRDTFAQVMRGTQRTVQIMVVVTVLATSLGVVVGSVAGWLGGRVDGLLMRAIDVALTIPALAVLLVLARRVQAADNWFPLSLVLAGFASLTVARVVRAEVLVLREREYVDAARSAGASGPSIVVRHVLPNLAGSLIVAATFTMAGAILAESALSYLGFGVQSPDTSLGLLVAQGQDAAQTRPWLFWYPGAVIVLLVLCVNFVGDGLRDAVDPRHGPAAPVTAPALVVEDLEVTFSTAEGLVHAVRGLSWSVASREVLALVGESGSGKTTAALAVMGLLPRGTRVAGSARLGGQELLGVPARQLDRVRGRAVTMVFQDPMSSLNPVQTVGAQVAEVVRVHERASRREAWRRAVAALDVVGLPQAAARASSYPHQLSGGMRQRVGIAMAMVSGPTVLLADEPTTALDVTVQAQVLDALRRAQEATGVAVVLITHDLGVVAGLADRVVVMYAGRAVEEAGVDDLFEHPRMPYTRGLLAALPRIDRDGPVRLTAIPGAPPSAGTIHLGCPFQPRCPAAVEVCATREPALEAHGRPEHPAACHRTTELEGAREPA